MGFMSNEVVVPTNVGDLAVWIHGTGRATVRVAGLDSASVQVGKFTYKVNIVFLANSDGKWEPESTTVLPTVYHAEGKKFFEPAAPTIKAKVVAAAKDALLRALADNPLAMVRADVKNAQTNWARKNKALDDLQEKLNEAQREADAAEKAYYDTVDRLDTIQLALQAAGAK